MSTPLSSRHPALYFLSVGLRRLHRRLVWHLDGRRYAREQRDELLPFRVIKHQSVLLKKLGESDMHLQRNKVVNLGIAVRPLHGLIIRPGEVFSFCLRVGPPTARRGFLPGMELSFGKARAGIGGGICQISNLIHWMVLHSPLTVTERRHHSFDPFPDEGRVLPFGSGATVFYNYIDYQFTNTTQHTFQLRFWFSEKCLEGELRCDVNLPYRYHVKEENHAFLKQDGAFYRQNEIWREKIEKGHNGRMLERELVTKNFARVLYVPAGFAEDDGHGGALPLQTSPQGD